MGSAKKPKPRLGWNPAAAVAHTARRMRWLRRIAILLLAVVLVVAAWLAAGAIVYSPEYVARVVQHGQSDVNLYLDGLPLSTLEPAPSAFTFADAKDDAAARAVLEAGFAVDDLEAFLAETGTQALIAIKDDTVIYEGYANGTLRESPVTSFSVAKSVVSALVGIAIDEGHIDDVDDPVTKYLPELGERDPAFADITVRHLLQMASGLDYQALRWWLLNGDDPLTTYYPDQREISLENTNIVDPPGQYFLYNKYHPQLLGMILERATGVSVTEYTQSRLWDPLGMEFGGAWALDSEESGFEKMEAGLNASAIDFAKFGRLLLEQGSWEGRQVVSSEWVAESTGLDPSIHDEDYYSQGFGPWVYDDGRGYYAYMWYGKLRDGQPPDIAAEGDRGQIIYVSPAHDVVIVRNGTDYGIPLEDWTNTFYRIAAEL